jgi:hypothetical protein
LFLSGLKRQRRRRGCGIVISANGTLIQDTPFRGTHHTGRI